MSRVVIVDDHPVIRLAVRVVLEREGYLVEAEADNGVDAVSLVQKLKPDVIVLDIGIPRLDGFEVIMRVRKLALATKILVLSIEPSAYMVSRCIQAGASGYISKEKDLSELVDAIKAVLNNNNYFPSYDLNPMGNIVGLQSETVNFNALSNRELMVFKQLVMGKTNNEIACDMLLSPKTISTYKFRIFCKLNAKNITDLIEIARRII